MIFKLKWGSLSIHLHMISLEIIDTYWNSLVSHLPSPAVLVLNKLPAGTISYSEKLQYTASRTTTCIVFNGVD